jgi:phosphoglucosamine mutase
VLDAVRAVEAEMGPRGRVLLRYSGTEPKARLLLEFAESTPLEAWSRRILDALKAEVG